jgi:hypothetical protein
MYQMKSIFSIPMAGQLRQPEFFNLIDDPGERNNRAKTQH